MRISLCFQVWNPGCQCDVAWLNYANRCWITRCNRSSINDIQTKDSQVCVLPFSNYSAVQSCLLGPQHIHMCRFSLSDHSSMTGSTPSSKIDVEHFIDISCLVPSKSVADWCIELFWSISSDLLCLGVSVCFYWRSQEQKGRTGRRQRHCDKVSPLTSLCADKAGHTLTHTLRNTQTAIPEHQSLITHVSVIFLRLCLLLQILLYFLIRIHLGSSIAENVDIGTVQKM